jgi:hypothetical protein
MFFEFNVHGSVHLGNVSVRLKVQLDVPGSVCMYYFIVFVLHVSSAICTHHQEHKLQSTAIDVRNLWKAEVINSRILLITLCLPQITHPYGCILQFVPLMMGANSTRNM